MRNGGGLPMAALLALAAAVAWAVPGLAGTREEGAMAEKILLKGGTVYDGTGAPGTLADVLISGDSIVAVGSLLADDPALAKSARVIDVTGLAVCPGFVDVHNHTGESLSAGDDEEFCRTLPEVGQGITTIVAGMDGGGEADLRLYREKLAKHPRSVNIARLVGHRAARRAVIGAEQRAATPEELERMAAIVDRAMSEGAFGLSSGLEYLGSYASTEEVIALARAVAPYGGYYETHLRNEDVGVIEATREAIRICREAGIALSISHIKVGSYEVWHQAPKLLEVMEEARAGGLAVYANWRSSIQWSSNLASLNVGGANDLAAIDDELRKYWPKADAYCHRSPAHPEIEGRTLAEIALDWSVTPAQALVRIWELGGAQFEFSAMTWQDKRTFILNPWTMVSSDGGFPGSRRDPMIWNCFPIFFGRMIREWQWMPLETAIHKCTGLPARMVGLRDRGVLAPGMKADVTVFNAATISGDEHWDMWDSRPTGIEYVLVNGIVVMENGSHTGARPGVLLRKEGDTPAR